MEKNFPGSSLIQDGYEIILNESGPADMGIVLNHAKPGMWISNCGLGVYKLVQDPPQAGIFGRYTRHNPKWATRLLTPFPEDARPVSAVVIFPAIFNWHLGKSYDELNSYSISSKSRDISVVASSKVALPGHRARYDFVKEIEDHLPEIQVFGRGRARELADGKWSGISPFRFSIAVENERHQDYFTEKVLDCWLAGAVPIYFGAPNLDKYFPEDSFYSLKSLEFEDFRGLVREGLFSIQSYARRLESVRVSRQLVLDRFSMDSMIRRVLKLSGELGNVEQSGRRINLTDLDSLVHSGRDVVAKAIGRLGNS
jgi:hypothetical protein